MKESPSPRKPSVGLPQPDRDFHISGPSLPEDMVEIFKENFGDYEKGTLIGLIDFSRGFEN